MIQLSAYIDETRLWVIVWTKGRDKFMTPTTLDEALRILKYLPEAEIREIPK